MASAPTEKQLEAFAAVSHYWEALGEPVPASHVARRIGVTRNRVLEHFAALNRLGWLRGPGTPAVPTRSLPPDPYR